MMLNTAAGDAIGGLGGAVYAASSTAYDANQEMHELLLEKERAEREYQRALHKR